jgi:Domain of unknown function (DUF4406)
MTDKIKVYLAGAMTEAGGNYNFPLFDFIAEKLRATGKCEVFNPADLARKELGSLEIIQKMDKKDLKTKLKPLMREEILWIIDSADIVFLLPDWQSSEGARLERAVAERFGIRVYEAPDVILLQDHMAQNFDVAKLLDEE